MSALMARALLLLMLLCGCQAFANQDATHARLTAGPDSIETLLRLPKGLQAGRYVVQCEAWVGRKGRTHRFACYSAHEGQRALVNAVRAAGRRAKFVPATRTGVTVDVYMLVMVRIDTTQREPLILAVPNNGVEAERYGLLYSAPQRFNEFTWNANNWAGRSGRILLWQKMHIDEDGKVLECLVTNASGAPDFLVERIEEQVKRMEFMPGYFEGKAVAMFYTEPVFD
jgi:hypothetical protein